VIDDEDSDEGRRETCTLSLELSKPMKKLLELESSNAMFKQPDAIRLLRLWFHGCLAPAGEILLAIRQLKFVKNNTVESNINHGTRNVSSALTSEVTGRSAIPESFWVEVPVFATAYTGFKEQIELIVDIDDATETIRFVPAPGSIEKAIANAEARVGASLKANLDDLMGLTYDTNDDGVYVDSNSDPVGVPPVYYGKPE
jgi:hypothetical protein